MEIVVGGHYHLRRRIGAGSFGEVYLGEDIQLHEQVAIKLEQVRSRAPQLLYESKLYLLFAGGICVPRLHWFGTEANYNVMVIDYLGKSLEDLFQLCHQQFTLKTVLMIADQCIAALQYIHHKSFIHRDVKPDNFLIGSSEKSSQIFIIDFGLSKKYRDPRTLDHMKYATGKSLTGTARYASINALKGYEQSRRDDLESLAYCLLYFLKGSLPWMGLDAKDRKQKYDRIRDVKAGTPILDLCRGLPVEFREFLTKVRNLDFAEEPDYSGYRNMFRELLIREGYAYDYQYDWVPFVSRRFTCQLSGQINSGNNQVNSNNAQMSPISPHAGNTSAAHSRHEANMSKVAQHSVKAPEVGASTDEIDADLQNSNLSPNHPHAIRLADTSKTNISESTPDTKSSMSPRPPVPKISTNQKKSALPLPMRTGSSSHLRATTHSKHGQRSIGIGKPKPTTALPQPKRSPR
ncbi:CK1 family protein kinase [Tritrichomonas foetus]|uniref:non-specific serine/threonine protein kinase n=1 Tax=Tritrichomonas foetus TaxID=1144522 RepID=A0A1J4JM23_9EUKA|nr:CK1 family protein kinase [Tritrichomonas foetus]|eukprot:OHS99745.1 CK1 family protein kinase [Tritrichomonas foetus]